MRSAVRLGILSALIVVLNLPVGTQSREGLMGDLVRDVGQVETKIVGLAKAMPEGTYEWRPSKGVRSTSETLKHVAADNSAIRNPMLDVHRNVRRLYKDESIPFSFIRQRKPSRIQSVFAQTNTRAR